MGELISEQVRELLAGPNYATLATLNADGSPQCSPMWVGVDGDDLVFSTVAGRWKVRNIERDPRVSVSVVDHTDPERYVEIRGRAVVEPEGGVELDEKLAWVYDGGPADPDPPGTVRVVVRVTPTTVVGRMA